MIRSRVEYSQQIAALERRAADIAHEVRNALNNTVIFFEVLFEEIDHPERYRECRTHISAEIERMSYLTDSLLQYGKPAEKFEGAPQRLLPLMNSILKRCSLCQQKLHRIRLYSYSMSQLWVQCDRFRMEQMLVNLIDNAARYGPDGTDIRVSVACEESHSAVITVSDSGPGVPKENLDEIFEGFFTTRRHGTGLGLSIVKKILEAQGGSVRACNNSPAPGLSVEMRLPLSSPARLPVASNTATHARTAAFA